MKKNSIVFLQTVTAAFGIGVLTLMLRLPLTEGRNINATLFEVYFKDPFLACAYLVSILFFVALYQVFKLLGYIGKNETFSQKSIKALRTIKYCAQTFICFVLVGEAYLFIFERGKDDIAGGVFMGLLMIVVSGVAASVAGMFERIVKTNLAQSRD